MQFKKSRGFSLLELLVVMLIMTLIAGVVMPNYANSMTNLDLRRSVRHVATLLKESRNIAIFQAKTVHFEIDENTNSYRSEMGLQSYSIPAGIEMQLEGSSGSNSGDTSSIAFYADGTTTGGVISVRSDRNSFVVAVDWLTGDVSIK